MQLMKSLGAESVEEAMEIIQAAGIKPDDVPGLLASHGLGAGAGPPLPMEPPKLTRK
mgnify:CR=1 FL=1